MDTFIIVPALIRAGAGILQITRTAPCTFEDLRDGSIVLRDALSVAMHKYPDCEEFDVRSSTNKYVLSIFVYLKDNPPSGAAPACITVSGRAVLVADKGARTL